MASGTRIDGPAISIRVAGLPRARTYETSAHTPAPPKATDTANVAALVGSRNRYADANSRSERLI